MNIHKISGLVVYHRFRGEGRINLSDLVNQENNSDPSSCFVTFDTESEEVSRSLLSFTNNFETLQRLGLNL